MSEGMSMSDRADWLARSIAERFSLSDPLDGSEWLALRLGAAAALAGHEAAIRDELKSMAGLIIEYAQPQGASEGSAEPQPADIERELSEALACLGEG